MVTARLFCCHFLYKIHILERLMNFFLSNIGVSFPKFWSTRLFGDMLLKVNEIILMTFSSKLHFSYFYYVTYKFILPPPVVRRWGFSNTQLGFEVVWLNSLNFTITQAWQMYHVSVWLKAWWLTLHLLTTVDRSNSTLILDLASKCAFFSCFR